MSGAPGTTEPDLPWLEKFVRGDVLRSPQENKAGMIAGPTWGK